MARARRSATVLGLAIVLCQVAVPVLAAQTPASKTEVPRTDEEGTGSKMLKKAIRGGQNLAFGLLTDVPRTIYHESREHGPFVGVPIGLFKGMGPGLVRTGVGAYELFTFPLPTNDYKPVVLPALPFEPGPTEVFPDVP